MFAAPRLFVRRIGLNPSAIQRTFFSHDQSNPSLSHTNSRSSSYASLDKQPTSNFIQLEESRWFQLHDEDVLIMSNSLSFSVSIDSIEPKTPKVSTNTFLSPPPPQASSSTSSSSSSTAPWSDDQLLQFTAPTGNTQITSDPGGMEFGSPSSLSSRTIKTPKATPLDSSVISTTGNSMTDIFLDDPEVPPTSNKNEHGKRRREQDDEDQVKFKVEPTLCLGFLSCGKFMFDPDLGIMIAAKVTSHFLNRFPPDKFPSIKLFVLSQGGNAANSLSSFTQYLTTSDRRVKTAVFDVTKIKELDGSPCRFRFFLTFRHLDVFSDLDSLILFPSLLMIVQVRDERHERKVQPRVSFSIFFFFFFFSRMRI